MTRIREIGHDPITSTPTAPMTDFNWGHSNAKGLALLWFITNTTTLILAAGELIQAEWRIDTSAT